MCVIPQLGPSILYLHYLSASPQRHAYEDNWQLGGLAWKMGIQFKVAAQ
jgi:hypothetical protein